MSIRIKDWKKFQHFKDRNPPWIKLYRDILDDPDWHALEPKYSKILVMLWLVAADDPTREGALPDVRKLAFRLRITEADLCKAFQKLKHYLIQDDINLISERYQVDAPETETEAYKEETETYTGETETDVCTEPQAISAPTIIDEPVMLIPIVGKEKLFPVFQKDIDEWQVTFPGVDVMADLKKCRQWNVDYPEKRKTKRGVRGHISAWLGRTQDSGKGGRQQKLPSVAANQQTADRNARYLLGIE